MPLTIAVTGADGFIGRSVCAELERRAAAVRPRHARASGPPAQGGLQDRPGSCPGAAAEGLERILEGTDAVVHLAARAHASAKPSAIQTPPSNVRTSDLSATRNGLQPLLYAPGCGASCSSAAAIGVNGGIRRPERLSPSWTVRRRPSPTQGQNCVLSGRSGPWCEQRARAGRRPAVDGCYGAGVKGNFLRLMCMV